MDINLFLQSVRGKMPRETERLMLLQDRLEKMSKEEQDDFFSKKFPLLQFKNPTVILLINFFLGHLGIARFMIGDHGIGAIRLVLTIIGVFVSTDESLEMLYFLLLLGNNLIWMLIDLYLVDKKVREQNLNKILLVL